MKKKDLYRKEVEVGKKYNKLLITEISHHDSNNILWVWTLCDCGTKRKKMGMAVVNGTTKDCGCGKPKLTPEEKKLLPDHWYEMKNIILVYRRHARDRGYEFNLTDEQVLDLIQQNCFYCGVPPSNFRKRSPKYVKKDTSFYYNGIDRIDGEPFYNEENTVPCCSKCNTAKSDMNQKEFMEWISRLVGYQIETDNIGIR
jgi:5-methylcytosine-specific restriction endonuclease McrA